ncbi:MAG TPA: hypothetical protein VJ751_00550, partial [Pyrinomonadaceae bacterium]|nr:hypothetical protein [Pyrinomonadaceae bacterium]
MTRFAALLLCITFLLATASATKQKAPLMFEDFSYADKTELKNNGWIVRTEAGWPGIPGATWWDEGVTILKDPDNRNNWILRMTSATDGTAANTKQTQICHQRKYKEGTYAARVRFTDNPISGPGGDQIV